MGRCTQIYYDAAKAISKMKSGTEIPHQSMAKLVKIEKSFKAYHGRVGEVRDILKTEYRIFLKTIPKKGYEIVNSSAAIRECENQFYQGYRGMVRGVFNTQYINLDAMDSESDRTDTIEKAQKMAALAGLVRAGLTKSEIEKAEPKTLKDLVKAIGPVKEKSLPNGAGIGDAMKICRKRSSTVTSRN